MMAEENKAARISCEMLILALGISNLLLITQNLRLRKQLNAAGRIAASANSLKPAWVGKWVNRRIAEVTAALK